MRAPSLALLLLFAGTLPALPQAAPAPAAPASLLDGLAGSAPGSVWQRWFNGDAAARKAAEAEIAAAAAKPDAPATVNFEAFFAAWLQGHDAASLQALLHLLSQAPNDPATELALSLAAPEMSGRGKPFLEAVPLLRDTLAGRVHPLNDPAVAFQLGRLLLSAVGAPGVTLSRPAALQLAGRPEAWQLWGPFGRFPNLDFDHTFDIETAVAPAYPDGIGGTRTPQTFHASDGEVMFPDDWHPGVTYAVTFVHVAAATPASLRVESGASTVVLVNGAEMLRNDRRGDYSANAASTALVLPAGWSRVLVKLGGDASHDFDLMLRAANGAPLETSATPPPVALAGPARVDPAPLPGLAAWVASHAPAQALTLWVDGEARVQADDGENARVRLEQAARLAPNAAPVWLALADADATLDDASDSWMAEQVQAAAAAAKVAPEAVRIHDRLGHVLQSQGKQNDAAAEFAQCTGQGFADCDWSAFRLAQSRGWMPEAHAALTAALALDGSNWSGIGEALDFFTASGYAADTAAWLRLLRLDSRADLALGQYDLRHAQPAEAAEVLARAAAALPSSAVVRRAYLSALLQTSDKSATAAAQLALKDFPNEESIARLAGELQVRANIHAGAAPLQELDYDRLNLRHEADFVARNQFWQPWYHAAGDIIRSAPGKQQYPNASAILVLDQMVDRINPDSSRDSYIHQIFRVLDAQGIQLHGDVEIPPGSDLITIRTIKPDGTMLLPERLGNLASITMPGLEPGDFIETEYVMHTPVSSLVAETLDNNMFFVFNSSREPFHFSDYIVLTPDKYPLRIEQHDFDGDPVVHEADGWTSREWLIQKTRVLISEPNMPPEQDLVPKVWVSTDMGWNDISDYLADRLFDVRRATREMQAQAQALTAGKSSDRERADAIFDWVAANIQPADGSPFAPSRQAFTDRGGNRVGVFLGLLSAAHVPWRMVWARGITDTSTLRIPSLYQFQYPLVYVGGPLGPDTDAPPTSASGWYDLVGGFAQRSYLNPAVRGAEALIAGGAGDAPFTRVPQFDSPLDGMVLTVTGAVQDNGSADLHLSLEFRGPNGEQVREALQNQPDSRLPQIYQQLLVGNYPNATSSSGHILHRDDKQQPLVIDIDANVPDFVHADGASWDIAHIAGPVELLARYAPLPFRQFPLLISGDSFEQVSVDLKLPARFHPADLPPPADLTNDFGRFQSSLAMHDGDLVFNRTLFLKANVIPPELYSSFRAFGEAVDNQDQLRIGGAVQGQP